MAGWDLRFAAIMHETERSLARVKVTDVVQAACVT